jgi:hypothetical protein
VKSVFAALVPPAVVTRTLARPGALAEVVAVILVALTTFTFLARAPPIVTAVAPVKFVPVSVIRVPPALLPVAGDTDLTVGGGGGGVT